MEYVANCQQMVELTGGGVRCVLLSLINVQAETSNDIAQLVLMY